MPTPKPRRQFFNLRLTAGELATLRARARAADLALSSYLRHRVLTHRVRRRANRLAQADLDHLVALGQGLNRLTHAGNTAHRIVHPADLTRVLRDLRSLARRLQAKIQS
ncbi:MAG: plasmid mobilization protein [bacterium]